MKDEVVEDDGKKEKISSLPQHEEDDGKKKEKTSSLPQQEEEDCQLCMKYLQKDPSKFVRRMCCGKGMHFKCRNDINGKILKLEQNNQCALCRRKKNKRGSKDDIERLHHWVEKGKAWAQVMLGDKYAYGKGSEYAYGFDQSYQRAAELYEMAARQGHAVAQYNLGQMYYLGQGFEQSYEKAEEYYEAAARQGHADAQAKLGGLYANDEGVEQSDEKAREWWMKAAEQGLEEAIKGLQQLDKDEGRTTPSFVPGATPNVVVGGGGSSGGSGSSGSRRSSGGSSSNRSKRSGGKKIKPNQPCPCGWHGSGKKYKKCCK